jgi:hypothetical protein
MVHISLLDNSKTHFEEMAHYMPWDSHFWIIAIFVWQQHVFLALYVFADRNV